MGTRNITQELAAAHTDDAPPIDATNPVLAGDHHDDDGTVLDSLVQEQSEAPARTELPRETPTQRVVPTVPAPTRMFTTTLTTPMGGYGAPVMLMPADPWRKHLYITFNTDNNTKDQFLIGDSPSNVQNIATSFLNFCQSGALGSIFTIDDYTGAIWVAFTSSDGRPVTNRALTISAMAISGAAS